MHDPKVYEDPDDFRPERFIRNGKLDTAVRDPAAFIFGFGRRYVIACSWSAINATHLLCRICPGRYFAEAALFINVACALHVFDITPPLGEDGRPIEIKRGHTDGVISYVSASPYYGSSANIIHTVILRIIDAPSSRGLQVPKH